MSLRSCLACPARRPKFIRWYCSCCFCSSNVYVVLPPSRIRPGSAIGGMNSDVCWNMDTSCKKNIPPQPTLELKNVRRNVPKWCLAGIGGSSVQKLCFSSEAEAQDPEPAGRGSKRSEDPPDSRCTCGRSTGSPPGSDCIPYRAVGG